MAQVTSGSFKTSGYNGRHLIFEWTATQSVANNNSSISWTLTGAGDAPAAWYKAGNFKVVIAGETVYSSSARINLEKGTLVAKGTKVIAHNTDGSKSFSASAEAGIYYTNVNCTGSGAWDLKSIARGATITSAPNFTDDDDPTVAISNPAGNSVDALDICITLAGSNDDISYRAVYKTDKSYTFYLTDAERKILREATQGANTRKVGFYLRTKIGSNTFYSKVWKEYSIVNGTPTMAISAADVGGNSKALTGAGGSTIISGFNVIQVSTGASAKKEATLVSQKITCGGQTINGASGEFVNIATNDGKVVFTVTDSRKNTVTQTKTFNVIPYFKPTVNLAKNNVSTDGVFTIYVEGTFFNGSFGAVKNALVLQYRWKVGSNDWGAWTTVSPQINGNNYSFAGDKTNLDYRENYTVEVRATDSLLAKDNQYITAEPHTASGMPLFDWGKDGFNFNIPVTVEGKDLNTYLEREMMFRGYVSGDFNIYQSTGLYAYGGQDYANTPSKEYGILRVQNAHYITQELIVGTGIYVRRCTDGTWSTWRFIPAAEDYVVEQGSGGIWHWRKWSSGLAECWGVSTITTDIAAQFGGGYLCSDGATAKALVAYFPTNLFTSIIKTDAVCNVAGKLLFTTGSDYTKDKLNYYIWCPSASYTNLAVKVNFSAVGRWK